MLSGFCAYEYFECIQHIYVHTYLIQKSKHKNAIESTIAARIPELRMMMVMYLAERPFETENNELRTKTTYVEARKSTLNSRSINDFKYQPMAPKSSV